MKTSGISFTSPPSTPHTHTHKKKGPRGYFEGNKTAGVGSSAGAMSAMKDSCLCTWLRAEDMTIVHGCRDDGGGQSGSTAALLSHHYSLPCFRTFISLFRSPARRPRRRGELLPSQTHISGGTNSGSCFAAPVETQRDVSEPPHNNICLPVKGLRTIKARVRGHKGSRDLIFGSGEIRLFRY